MTTTRCLQLRAWEIQALDAGVKTQIRKVCRPPKNLFDKLLDTELLKMPGPRKALGEVGSVFWIKEPFWELPPSHIPEGAYTVNGRIGSGMGTHNTGRDLYRVMYAAQGYKPLQKRGTPTKSPDSGLQMIQRWSRFKLEITSLRRERLQDLTPEDAIAEGVGNLYENSMATALDPVVTFQHYWDRERTRNKDFDDRWDQNPLVWVADFKILEHTPFPVLTQEYSKARQWIP